MLRVQPITPDQNYFDLGGDSMLAVQMFTRIEQEFHVKLPLATLFDAPTVRELALVLQQETSASSWSPLVAIQPSGTRPPFFCVHPHGGEVLIYRDLARHLGLNQPFYALQSQGLDGSLAPLKTIEEMAELYLKEIRRVQARGPYYLGGYCMGGAVAYEIAQQLRANGEDVALLAMFDTPNYAHLETPTFLEGIYYTSERLIFHIANVLSLDSTEKVKFLNERMRLFRGRVPVWMSMAYGKIPSSSAGSVSESSALGRVWRANFRACAEYVPRPYAGKITAFNPAKQFRRLKNPNLKWDDLASEGLELVLVPVNPPGLLAEPYVLQLAKVLEVAIDGAIRNRET